ncbi:MAG: hypothetical protein HFF50_02205 [Lawsonibacter sp.]|nr:hypothetical protein [Lawsonibacter sp.]
MQDKIMQAMLNRGITRRQLGYDPLVSLVERFIQEPCLYNSALEEVARENNITVKALKSRIRTIARHCEWADPEGFQEMMVGGPYRLRLLVRTLADDAETLPPTTPNA